MEVSTRERRNQIGRSRHAAPGLWAAVAAAVYLSGATAFAVGEPFGELELTRALTLTALWVVPALVLPCAALTGRTWASTVAVGAALVLIAVQSVLRPIDVDTFGPVTVAALAAAWPVAALGLTHPDRAARAMVALGGAMFLSMALARGPRASTAVVALPLLLLAGAFALAARRHEHSDQPTRA